MPRFKGIATVSFCVTTSVIIVELLPRFKGIATVDRGVIIRETQVELLPRFKGIATKIVTFIYLNWIC